MCGNGGETHRSVSKDIGGRLIVLPEPLPLLIADRAGRIPLSVDRTEEAERLLAVVDPAMRRTRRDEQRIQRFQGDDLFRHEGFAPTTQDNDAVDVRVLLQAGITARRKLKIAKLKAGRHDRRPGEREPADVAPTHPALIAEREFVRLRLYTPPAKQRAIKGNLQTSQRGDKRGRSLRTQGHADRPSTGASRVGHHCEQMPAGVSRRADTAAGEGPWTGDPKSGLRSLGWVRGRPDDPPTRP